jgi:hypothetical protein
MWAEYELLEGRGAKCSNTPMMMKRLPHVFVMSLALLLVLGCENKGPTPKEGAPSAGTAPVGTTETGGAHPGGTQDPHAGMDMKQSPSDAAAVSGQPDASGMIDVGGISFKMPGEWQVQRPTSQMRRAQLGASGSAGPAQLIVYFFGPQGAGSTDANIERWIGQFTNADGSPVSDSKKTSSKVAGFEVTKLEVAGQYASGMAGGGQPDAPQAGQRLLAAIVNTTGGPYYFKFLGPSASVTENGAVFDALIASIVASP